MPTFLVVPIFHLNFGLAVGCKHGSQRGCTEKARRTSSHETEEGGDVGGEWGG